MFVVTPNAQPLSKDHVALLRGRIVRKLSHRHVPAVMIGVSAIPYNGSAKKLEVPVRKLINGTPKDKVNTSACINPECLPEYTADRPELQLPAGKRPSKL